MFDHPDPKHLIDSLVAFVEEWHGMRSWYGVAPDKLAACELPVPLANLYAALGNMPGTRGGPFGFSHQDTLLPFEWLQTENGRLLFALECEGCWRAYTRLAGDDPPVWFFFDEGKPELEHPSLANFLVTLCLQEITLSSTVTYAGDGLVDRFASRGFRVTPLWIHGSFPGFDGLLNNTFHLVEGRAIIFRDQWIGFRFTDDELYFEKGLHDAKRIHPPATASIADFLADPSTYPVAKRLVYERLAREHQAQADLHQSRADECRRLAQAVIGTQP